MTFSSRKRNPFCIAGAGGVDCAILRGIGFWDSVRSV
ncbi:hypothetical protein CCACVL1_12117 [Corchorus capsularis]|uniref:Uncharacterized protein n=1 Tax=Corchorus capsularis TaxID=210143 RepID=A0A1R3IHD3_COCAP|nr:hypothetical protein CCACVL1_12117 [Corchorus capsularis]